MLKKTQKWFHHSGPRAPVVVLKSVSSRDGLLFSLLVEFLVRKDAERVLYPLLLRVTSREEEAGQTSGEHPDTERLSGDLECPDYTWSAFE